MDGGPPRFGPGFTCPALLRDRVAPSGLGSRTGLSPAAAGPPMPFRSPAGPAPGGGSPRMRGPATPSAEPLPGMPARRFGHRSPFARRYSGSLEIDFLSSGYLDVSVPRVVLPAPMCSGWGYAHCCAWVRPFGDPRVEGCVLLAGDYRSLPRPSSPVGTKAFTVRPYLLHHIAKAVTTSTIPQSPFVTYCIVSLLGMHVYLVFCSCCSTTHFVGKRLLLSNRFLCHADVNFRFPSIIDFAGGPDRT